MTSRGPFTNIAYKQFRNILTSAAGPTSRISRRTTRKCVFWHKNLLRRYDAEVADIVVNPRVRIPESELQTSFARSGGPGGQNVNKVASKVELRWTPATSSALTEADRTWLLSKLAGRLTNDGELLVTSEKHRDQIRNRADAAEKLAEIVRAALFRPTPRRATKPTRGSKDRRISAKKRRGELKVGRRSGDD